jgi:sirohydrochlorin cobaltochelatase
MRAPILTLVLLTGACSPPDILPPGPVPISDGPGNVGVLVMAHGGSHEWNETVRDAVAPLAREVPTAIAFGMADPVTLESGLDSLRARGVAKVAVVRMFISGRSFLDQTRYLLGLSDVPPETFVLHGHPGPQEVPPVPIQHGMTLSTHTHGLMVSPHASRVVYDRARASSSNPSREALLILAHGMGDDEENENLLSAMASMSTRASAHGFASVHATALREDWAEKRAASEAAIREFVARQTRAGRRVIVVPMRLWGFGPYAEVLEGLDYVPTAGLLPHLSISDWVRDTASDVLCAHRWANPLDSCRRTVVEGDSAH